MTTKSLSKTTAELLDRMHEQTTTRGLYNLVTSEEFKSQVATLDDDNRQALKDDYDANMNFLRGKVKLDELQNEVITVSGVRDGVSQYGSFVVLKGQRENGHDFEAITSSAPIQRYFTPAILKELPVQLILKKEPFTLDDGKKVSRWVINRVGSNGNNSELPF